MKNYSVIDLFCGIGGLTHGFIKEEFNVISGYDIDPSCQYAFEANNIDTKFTCKRIEVITRQEILAMYPANSIKILVGCAPCQPFSSYTNSQPENKKNWGLLSEFLRLIQQVKPDIVSMENVMRLKTFKDGTVLNNFIEGLEREYYDVSLDKVYCPKYGIPQNRTRLVLLASKYGQINFLKPTHADLNYVTVRDAISHLPPIEAGEVHVDDRLHYSSMLSALNKKRIQVSKPGGSWRDWPNELVANCHKKDTGKTYPDVYGRMEWDKPSPTITTQCYGYGNGRFGHPEQDRAISLREAALLQTFPKSYKFASPNSKIHLKVIGKHIGNAVPIQLGRVIAQSIRKHLEKHNV
ncbi:DNA cytosine methyltransferase [Anaerolineales bacterium HSG24]|nr:DNA cytosine methyltransferase [Anaerolineales bacterium HSG24]